jgi:hypothetical protein
LAKQITENMHHVEVAAHLSAVSVQHPPEAGGVDFLLQAANSSQSHTPANGEFAAILSFKIK